MNCHCPTCQRKLHWLPTADDLARAVLRTTLAVGLLTLGMALGGSWMARVALDARQDSIDAQAATAACSALVDEAVHLTLDATTLARTVDKHRAAPWRMYALPEVVVVAQPTIQLSPLRHMGQGRHNVFDGSPDWRR